MQTGQVSDVSVLNVLQDFMRGESTGKLGANTITINRMKVRADSSINPFLDLSQIEILNKLEEDSLYKYFANVSIREGEHYENKKIYFNRDNGFLWGNKNRHYVKSTKTIGNLLPGSWYRFSDLGLISHSSVYVYIDSINVSHLFFVTLANY